MTDELLVASQQIAADLYAAIQHESNYSARSLQAKDFQVGVSDLGFCPERTRRMIDQQVPAESDMLSAWIGTELGNGMERVAQKLWPTAIMQSEVEVVLVGDSQREYTLTGHPDCVLPDESLVIDFKTDYGLAVPEKSGPTMSQQFQRHLYGLGAYNAGMFPHAVSPEDVRVANVWMDRSAIEKRLHCDLEPLSLDVVEQAGQWLDDVVYAYLQGEEAHKAPPRDMCAVVCGFYEVCRAYDTDVSGLIEDPEALDAVTLYREGMELEKQGKALKSQAKQHLVGVQGSTGEFAVRWTWVNDSVIPETVRRGYEKLEVRALPKRKADK